MLVYEKTVDNDKHLFGTLGNIPAEEDVKLTYRDNDDVELTPNLNDSYFDDKEGGIIRKSDNKAVNVFIGDKNIIPGNIEFVNEEVNVEIPEELEKEQEEELGKEE